jgi:hypothetical protein
MTLQMTLLVQHNNHLLTLTLFYALLHAFILINSFLNHCPKLTDHLPRALSHLF